MISTSIPDGYFMPPLAFIRKENKISASVYSEYPNSFKKIEISEPMTLAKKSVLGNALPLMAAPINII